MPQIDTLSFGTQIFWTSFTFLIVYFLLLKAHLPNVLYALKLRQLKINIENSNTDGVKLINTGIAWSLDKEIFKAKNIGLKTKKFFINNNLKKVLEVC